MWHGDMRAYTKAGGMERKQISEMFFQWLKFNQVTRVYPYKGITKMVFI